MKKLLSFAAAVAMSLPAMAQTAATDTISAVYPGGDKEMTKYINANLRYPQTALRNGIEGVVSVRFKVSASGLLSDFTVVRLVDPDLEAEAIRLVKGMPSWTPATLGGKPVESTGLLKIPFILPE